MRPARSILLQSLLGGVAISCAAAAAPGKVEFNRDIRPILSENCFYCHGPDKGHRKSGLRLDVRAEATKAAKSGSTAIVPGDPGASEMLLRLGSQDPEEVMPPPDTHKSVSAAQRELLKRWIAEGAEYQPHWAYIKPARPAVPSVKKVGWVRNPIDAFILARLEAQGITPSAEAERRTLLRRLSLDLTGLPPTPEEMLAFLAEPNAGAAYEKAVDRLLASPHYGERMAVPWLDVVRFADTVGYHGDQNANVFPYRDYVIDAFNSNKPFDQFTLEQIAGDLLPKPGPEQKVASCFNRLNMVTREGGAQPKEYLTKYAADRVRTVSGAWLGSTMGCAECHDHKFDPFTTRDFYSMAAFFADIRQWGVYADYKYTPNPDLKGVGNEHPFPPEITVISPALQRRDAALRARLKALADPVAAKAAAPFAQWRTEVEAFLKKAPAGWATLTPLPPPPVVEPPVPQAAPEPVGEAKPVAETKPATEGKAAAETKPVAATKPGARPAKAPAKAKPKAEPSVTAKLEFEPAPGRVAALRLEVLPEGKNGSLYREGAKPAMFKLAATLRRKGTDKPVPVSFRAADANFKEPRYDGGAELIGILGGWNLKEAPAGKTPTAVWLPSAPLVIAAGDTLELVLEGGNFASVRVSASPVAPLDLRQPEAKPDLSSVGWLRSTGFDAAAFQECQRVERELALNRGGEARVLVTESIAPAVTRVLARGNWQDESGEVVSPAVPAFLSEPARKERLTRLDLAQWLVSKDNPLTARVQVNRLWKQFFGNALSAAPDDLGAQGEWPTHPELLDWLAVEFRDSGWDTRHMVKLIVLSSTYRQGSSLRPELADADPNNRLLASQNPRRLEAEFVRDNALAIAGLLSPEMGGPSAFPYQPANYYENLQFPDRTYKADTDARQYRRGLYTHWQRTFLHPMLANFDAPSRDECTAARTVANTPQQALTLLNDPTFVEAARVFAARLLEGAGDDGARLAAAFERALGRPVKPQERDSLLSFLGVQRTYYKAHPEDAKKLIKTGLSPVSEKADPSELAAWATVARVIFNLHETITRY